MGGITIQNNEDIMKEYNQFLELQSMAPNTIYNRVRSVRYFLEFGQKQLADVTQKDVEAYFLHEKKKVDSGQTKASSVNLYVSALRLFFEWLKPENEMFKNIKEIKILYDSTEKKYITTEDIKKMLACCTSQRDRALLMLIYNSGARLGEIRALNVGDVDLENGVINVKGKTGKRSIPITTCIPDLRVYMNMHTHDKNAPLFYGRYPPNRLLERSIQDAIAALVEKAGIKTDGKKVNVHALRHRRLTELATQGMPEMHMRKYAGWTKRSNMPAVYIHPEDEEIKELVLSADGMPVKPKDVVIKQEFKPIICPNCDTENAADAKYCSKCSKILDEKVAMEVQEEREADMNEMKKQMQNMNMFMQALANGDEKALDMLHFLKKD